MQQLLNQFTETLAQEREVHTELLTLSEQKKDAITRNDIISLDRIVKGEEVLLSRLNQWEQKRRACVRDLAGQLGRPEGEVVLRDILPLCGRAQQEQLETLHEELTSLLQRQLAVNDLNKRLIESRLEYINYSLETAAGAGQSFHTYGGEGRESGRPARKTNIIDQKI